MRTERDPDRLDGTCIEGDPKVIDVRRNAIDFGREGNDFSGDVNELAVVKLKRTAVSALSM